MSPEKIIIGVIVIFLVFGGILLFQLFSDGGEPDVDPIVRNRPGDTEPGIIEDDIEIGPVDDQAGTLEREELVPTSTGVEEGRGMGAVFGRVLTTDRKPLEGARVALCYGSGLFMSFPSARQETGVEDTTTDRGAFRLDGLIPGREYAVLVSHEGFADTSRSPVVVQTEALVELADIVMNEGLAVRGRVSNESGVPLSGAQVLIQDPTVVAFNTVSEPKILKKTATDSAGLYLFENISTATFEVRVVAEGYGSQTKRSFQFDAKELKDIDFELGPAMSIQGVVKGPDELPVAGAQVWASKARAKEFSSTGTATTLDNGTFLVDGISDGAYVLRVTCEGYSIATRQRVRAGAVDVVIKLQQQGSITGTVRDQKTGDPLSQYTLSVLKFRPGKPAFKVGITQKVSSTDGTYLLANLDPDNYVIEVTAPGYAKCSSDRIQVARGVVAEGADVFMNRGGSLTGRVVDSRGSPLRGVEVILRHNNYVDVDLFGFFSGGASPEDQGDSGTRAVTDNDGYFTKRLITPGTFQAHFRHPDHTDKSINDVTVFQGDDAATDLGVVKLSVGGTIKGKTLDTGGSAMPGAVVILSREDGFQRQVVSDKDAFFQFKHLEPGKYSVTIQADPMSGSQDFNIFSQLVIADQSKVDLYLDEGSVENIVVRLVQ